MPQWEVFKFDHDPLLPVAWKPAHWSVMVLVTPCDDIPQHLFECSLLRQVMGLTMAFVHEAPGMQFILHFTMHMH